MKRMMVIIAVLIVALMTQVWAQPKAEKMHKEFMEKLNLTADQQKQIDKLRSDMQKEMIDQNAKIAKARIEMKDILKADNPDKSAIQKKIQEIANLTVESKMIKVNHWFAVNKLLTADQQKEWRKALELGDKMERHGMMRSHQGKNRDGDQMKEMHRPPGDMNPMPQGQQE